MAFSDSVSQSKIQQWIDDNSDIQKIREELSVQGYDTETIEIYVKEFKKVKFGKRQTNAFILLAGGAFLGFLSCVLSIINPVPEFYYWILYGFTSVSIVIVFWGLYLLFE